MVDAVVTTLLSIGVRIEELVTTTWEGVKLQRRSGWRDVVGKRGKHRRVPLNAEARLLEHVSNWTPSRAQPHHCVSMTATEDAEAPNGRISALFWACDRDSGIDLTRFCDHTGLCESDRVASRRDYRPPGVEPHQPADTQASCQERRLGPLVSTAGLTCDYSTYTSICVPDLRLPLPSVNCIVSIADELYHMPT
jgi:hypothetical protein